MKKRKTSKKTDQSAASPLNKSGSQSTVARDEQSTNTEPENPFDFGGLPPRDLKKNLGCG